MTDAVSVLVVEDDVFMANALRDKLSREGHTAAVAKNGEEALVMMRDNKPRLVLLDLIMPKKTGFDVLREMQQDAGLRDVPVVILSNLGDEKAKKQAKELGAVEFLIKANTPIKEIAKKIKKYL